MPPLPPPDIDACAFQALVAASIKHLKTPPSKFVKKLDEIPKFVLSSPAARKIALALANHGLIGQFTRIWPSPKTVALWMNKKWIPPIKGSMNHFFYGKGFYAFLFELKEGRDLTFRNSPYFLGAWGMHLNKWTPNFNPKNDVPSTVSVWVCLPHPPLHCWRDDALRCIGNSLGRYIDRVEPKENTPVHGSVWKSIWRREYWKQ